MFKKRKRASYFYMLVFFVGMLFLLNRFVIPLSTVFRPVYSVLFYPVLLSQKYVVSPWKQYMDKRKNRKHLEELVFKLHKDKENLAAENVALKSVCAYYENIQELLEFKKRYSYTDLQLCHVMFKHVNEASHFFLIDKGSTHGITPDMVAIYKNFLIGRVVEVFPFYSKVLLITDKSCKVAAYCAKTKANGIHIGCNNLRSSCLDRVSHLSEVKNEDLVLSSGYGTVFPQGFALGKIYYVQRDELYYNIELRPLFDINRIHYCFIIKKGHYDCS